MDSGTSEPRLFTVEEAHKVLEEVRPMVARMLQAFEEMRKEIDSATHSAGLRIGDPGLLRHLEGRGVAPRLLEEINDTIEHIQARGCVINGPETGLVDFPCLMGGEIVLLCWKYGEPGIGHWHRIEEGFSSRRALLEHEERTDRGARVH